MSTKRRTILVTGSNGGLGSQIVSYLLRKGIANIACHYRNSSHVIENILGKADINSDKHLYFADLTDENDIASMRKAIEQNLGEVEALINLAGGSSNGLSWKLTKQEFQEIVDKNLLCTFLCSKEFIPTMRKNEIGSIINISSIIGSTGVAGAAHYCAAKAGIDALTKSMALELANKNITVNSLALGYYNAGIIEHVPKKILESIINQIPFQRLGEPDEVAAFIWHLISDEARYLTGQVFHLNGGLYR